MNRTLRSVVFDFDYTLADSSVGVIECVNFALGSMGLPIVSTERACRTIGLSLTETFRQLADEGERARSQEFARLFAQRADQVMAERTVLFDAVPSTVRALIGQRLTLGIVSTKFRYRIQAILQREDLADSFEVIVGGEDVAQHKPDPAGLLAAIGQMGCTSEEVLYVGDSVTDAETAKRGKVAFVAVLSGVTPGEAFRDYDVCAVLEDVSELPQYVRSIRSQKSEVRSQNLSFADL